MSFTFALIISGGVLFLISSWLLAYYSLRNARAMKDSRGRLIIAAGAVLFFGVAVIDAIDFLWFSSAGWGLVTFYLWMFSFVVFAVGKTMVAMSVRKVYHGSTAKMLLERPGSIYDAIGIWFLFFCGVPLYIWSIIDPPLSQDSWQNLAGALVWALGFMSLAMAARTYCLSDIKSSGKISNTKHLKDDVLAVMCYGDLLNTYLVTMKPIPRFFRESITDFFEYNPILFEDCALTPDGTMQIQPIIRNAGRIYKERRVQEICIIFSALSSRLIELFGRVTSLEHAQAMLSQSYYTLKGKYKDTSVLFEVLRSLPKGVLQEERLSLLSKEELEARVRERTRELEESRNYISNVVRSMTDMLIVVDPDGKIKTVNKATEDSLGYAESELIGQPIEMILTKRGAAELMGEKFENLTKSGFARNVEKTYVPKYGDEIPVLSSNSIMYDDEGKIQGIVCVAQDITERKLAEEKEKKYVSNLLFLSETAMDFVRFPNNEDIYKFIGKKLKQLVGDGAVLVASFDKKDNLLRPCLFLPSGKEDEEGTRILESHVKEHPGRLKEEYRSVLLGGATVEVQDGLHSIIERVTPNGNEEEFRKIHDFGNTYAIGFSTGGELFGAAVILMGKGVELEGRDIIDTFAHEASLALQRRQAELQIEDSLAEKEVLLKEIHHRVKNNLQIISSLLRLQSSYITDEKAVEMFKESQSRVRSMALIHEKLYRSDDLARIDFADYIRDLTTYLFRMYKHASSNIELKVDVNNVSLGIDAAIPCGLIINELVSNSLKYAFPEDSFAAGDNDSRELESRGEVFVKLQPDGKGNLLLTVGDNGVGMPADLDFQNTESLGLQLVNTLTEQLDGTIELDGENGTTFRISFAQP